MERAYETELSGKLDLTRLNAAEVQVLELLADGHTAKSIASLTDRSVVSVIVGGACAVWSAKTFRTRS